MFVRPSHLFAVLTLAASMLGGLALVAGEGCTVLTNDALPDDAGDFEGGDAATTDPCSVCLAAACLAPAALCLSDDTCAVIADCDGDAGCVCGVSSDGGTSPSQLHHAFTSCFDAQLASCVTECGALGPTTLAACASGDDDAGSDAGDAGTDAGPTGPDACVACASDNCASAVASCGSGSECEAFLACSSACTTSTCVTDCGSAHATGKVQASELATCTAASCKNDCEL